MKKEISVLMANYNNSKYIADAIKSVLCQTFNDWELIILDDCSTDNSVDVVSGYLNDFRIKLFRNENNIGKIGALKVMIDKSVSPIICILDSDDVLMPDALEEIYLAHQKHPDCGFIYSSVMHCDEFLREIGRGINDKIPKGKAVICCEWGGAFTSFSRKAFLKTGGYDDDILFAEDADLVLKMEEITKLFFINKALYKYRTLYYSQSHDPIKRLISRSSYMLAKYKAYKRRLGGNIVNLTNKGVSFCLLEGFIQSIKLKDLGNAKFFLVESVKICPFNFRGYLMLFWKLIKLPFYRLIRKIYPDIEKIYD